MTDPEKLQALNDAITEIDLTLTEKVSGYREVYIYDRAKCIIAVEIEGDWKHDHLYSKHLMKELGYVYLRENCAESDSDYYFATHFYLVGDVKLKKLLEAMD